MNNATHTASSSSAPTFAAGTCRTCGRPADAPYRRVVGGVVVEGCIDAAHGGHADAWHMRPTAQVFRAEMVARMATMFGRHGEAAEAAAEADMLRKEHGLPMPRRARRRAA